jgi:hypothetical protein
MAPGTKYHTISLIQSPATFYKSQWKEWKTQNIMWSILEVKRKDIISSCNSQISQGDHFSQ